jgi:hypothetical protein
MFLTFEISFHLERSNLSHHARLKYHAALSLQVRLHPVHSTPFKIYAARFHSTHYAETAFPLPFKWREPHIFAGR